MNPKLLVQDMRGLGERRVGIAVGDFVRDDLVGRQLTAHGRRTGTLCGPTIGRRRQDVVVDEDERHGVFRNIAIVGDDDGGIGRQRAGELREGALVDAEKPA